VGAVSGLVPVLIVAIVFGFAYSIVKLAMEQNEKIERMKHGYPLKDGTRKMETRADVVDHRGEYNGN